MHVGRDWEGPHVCCTYQTSKNSYICTLLPYSFSSTSLARALRTWRWSTWDSDTLLLNPDYQNYSVTAQLQHSPAAPQVPLRVCSIQTPLCPAAWRAALLHHPNQPLTQFFLEGITRSFHIGYNHFSNSKLKSARKICKEPYNILLL